MMERFNRSIQLVKASYRVLRSDRELLIYPIVSFLVLLVVTLSFALPLYATGALERAADGRFDVSTAVVAFLFYFVSYAVIIFCNSALVGAAMIRLDGGDPTLADGWRIAARRLPAILGYAAISATVGVILRAISERGGLLGAIAAMLVGIAWGIATFLAVPVLVVEGVGPIDAIKRSAGLVRQTWGEQLVGGAGIGLVFGLIALGVGLLGALLVAVLASVSPVLAVAAVILVVVAILAIALFASALSGIFTASLYRYATKGDGGMFSPQDLGAAFQHKG